MDAEKMAEVYDKYRNTVYRTAYAYLRSAADAEDITHDVFIKRFTSSIEFGSDAKEKAWLLTVTSNMCKDLFRSVRYRILRSALPIEDADIACGMPEESAVFSAVMSLPEKYRVVIHLYYYEEYPIKDISRITGRSETSVQTMLYRARGKLKKILGEEMQI